MTQRRRAWQRCGGLGGMRARALCVLLVACGQLAASSDLPKQLYEGSACRTAAGEAGVCRLLTRGDCPWAVEELVADRRPETCGFAGLQVIVCCPGVAATTAAVQPFAGGSEPEASTTPPSNFGRTAREKCREYAKHVFVEEHSVSLMHSTDSVDHCVTTADPLIVGGTKAKPKEFPHMALIGYDSDDGIEYKCGGSLISPDFVLTAAHCLFAGQSPAQWVRLGELDRATDADDARPQVVRVAERVPHPDYRPPAAYDDIALLRLQAAAVMSGYVRPACLHTRRALRPREEVPVASGWGGTAWGGDPSDHLMRVALRLEDEDKCAKVYAPDRLKVTRGLQFDRQLCAGGTAKDTCQGDSGGPLQVLSRNASGDPYCMYNIVGITSFGSACGFAPGVYTRVYHYVPWIEQAVWPAAAAAAALE